MFFWKKRTPLLQVTKGDQSKWLVSGLSGKRLRAKLTLNCRKRDTLSSRNARSLNLRLRGNTLELCSDLCFVIAIEFDQPFFFEK
jgi:hypothetical protein